MFSLTFHIEKCTEREQAIKKKQQNKIKRVSQQMQKLRESVKRQEQAK